MTNARPVPILTAGLFVILLPNIVDCSSHLSPGWLQRPAQSQNEGASKPRRVQESLSSLSAGGVCQSVARPIEAVQRRRGLFKTVSALLSAPDPFSKHRGDKHIERHTLMVCTSDKRGMKVPWHTLPPLTTKCATRFRNRSSKLPQGFLIRSQCVSTFQHCFFGSRTVSDATGKPGELDQVTATFFRSKRANLKVRKFIRHRFLLLCQSFMGIA